MRLLLSALAFLLAASAAAQDEIIERRSGYDTVYGVKDENAKMNAAIEQARATFTYFFDALESGQHPRNSFVLKIETETIPGEVEHMWFVFMEFTEDSQVSGYLINTPYAEGSRYKAGEIYSMDPADVSDWSYIDNGKRRGNFTTRVILEDLAQSDPEAYARQMEGYHANPLPED